MRLIEFCPGEGSRYLVTAELMRPLDAHRIGGSLHTVLISFGTEEPGGLQTYWFEATLLRSCVETPTLRSFLSREYFEQKMPHLDAAARIVGLWVVSDLLGRETIDAKYTPEQLDWSPNWREQLALLRAITLGVDEATIERARIS